MKTRFLLISFFAFLFFIQTNFELKSENEIVQNLPKLLGASNVGKEFWITIPPGMTTQEGSGLINFVRIYVTSQYQISVTLEIPGRNIKQVKTIEPYEVAEFKLSPEIAQCLTKQPQQQVYEDKVYTSYGIYLSASAPFITYVSIDYNEVGGGFLAIPVSSLGKEYIVAGYSVDPSFESFNPPYYLLGYVAIVSPFNNTNVNIKIGGNNLTTTASGFKPNDIIKKVLNKGDVYLIATKGPGSDLSGTKIWADKPIAVITGNECAIIPIGNRYCDYIVEMQIPTFSWDRVYPIPNIAKIPPRKKPPIIRVYALEKNTTLFRNGRHFAFLKNSSGLENDGWIETRMNTEDVPYRNYPLVISGDKPIFVSLYSTNPYEDGNPNPNINAFQMSCIPFGQYSNEAIFFDPNPNEGVEYTSNHIGLIYQSSETGLAPDDLEICEIKNGQCNWKKINVLYPGVDQVIDYMLDGKIYAYKNMSTSTRKIYKIRANTPFAVYLYGSGTSNSPTYGFPASFGLKDQTKPNDTLPPFPTYSYSKGKYSGSVTDLPSDTSVRSNLSLIFMHPEPISYNVSFKHSEFIPGNNHSATWQVNVLDTNQKARAVITFCDRRGNDTTIIIEYKPLRIYTPKLTIRPSFADFGIFKKGGATVAKDFWIVNENLLDTALVTTLQFKDGSQNFTINLLGKNLPLKIPPNDSVLFKVHFNPLDVGFFTDSIGVGDTSMFAYKSKVQATVLETKLEIHPNFADWDTLPKGNVRKFKEFWVVNQTEQLPALISMLKLKDGKQNFEIELLDQSLPFSIPPNDSVKFLVWFTPIDVGTFEDSIGVGETNSFAYKAMVRASVVEYNTVSSEIGNKFYLCDIVPNPVLNNIIELKFGVAYDGWTEVAIVNTSGEVVRRVVTGKIKAGDYTVRVDVGDLSSGMYFVTMHSQSYREIKQFILKK